MIAWLTDQAFFSSVQLPTFTSPSSTPTHCPGSTTRCSSVRPTSWWGWSKTGSAWSSCCRLDTTGIFLSSASVIVEVIMVKFVLKTSFEFSVFCCPLCCPPIGFQQASEPCQYSLIPEVPESNVEPDASVYSRLPQIHLQRLWQRHRPPYQTMGVSFSL